MRLGVVMMGAGAHAAACVGVLQELEQRGIEPYAVCGMQGGAWTAALYAAGYDAAGMEKALHQAASLGRKMIAPSWFERLYPAEKRMPAGVRMNRLLSAQTGQRVLALCPRAALFPCRMARNGQRVVFSTRAFMQDAGAVLAMQASVGFAARACLAMPPYLAPLSFMGSPLLGETDVSFAVRQLMLLGAHRVLAVEPYPSPRHISDAADLTAAALQLAGELGKAPLGESAGVLRIIMPETAGTLSFEQAQTCCEAGRAAARRDLDLCFDQMGMARCRVLPFRRQTI